MNEKECDDFGHNVTFCPKVLLFFSNQQYQLPQLSVGDMVIQKMEYYPVC